MSWTKEVFGIDKPIIAMCHLQAMPGDPIYDKAGGIQKVLELAKHDLLALQEGGVDAVMFSNEFSLPYKTRVDTNTVASMAYVIGRLVDEISVPFGVNCLWDPIASLDLAAGCGARFIREIISGVYASDFGLWDTDSGNVARHRIAVCAEDVRMFYNIVPEAAKYLVDRPIEQIAKTTVFNCHPDALCVSGQTAGIPADMQTVRRVKSAVPDTIVFCNTGCRKDTIAENLNVSDGAIVATTFKKDGVFENLVDVKRVKAFMAVVNDSRS